MNYCKILASHLWVVDLSFLGLGLLVGWIVGFHVGKGDRPKDGGAD